MPQFTRSEALNFKMRSTLSFNYVRGDGKLVLFVCPKCERVNKTDEMATGKCHWCQAEEAKVTEIHISKPSAVTKSWSCEYLGCKERAQVTLSVGGELCWYCDLHAEVVFDANPDAELKMGNNQYRKGAGGRA